MAAPSNGSLRYGVSDLAASQMQIKQHKIAPQNYATESKACKKFAVRTLIALMKSNKKHLIDISLHTANTLS